MDLPANSPALGFARQRYACEMLTKIEDVAAHLHVMAELLEFTGVDVAVEVVS